MTTQTEQQTIVLTDYEGRLAGVDDDDWARAFETIGGLSELRFPGDAKGVVINTQVDSLAFDFERIQDHPDGRAVILSTCYPTDFDDMPLRMGDIGHAVLYCGTGSGMNRAAVHGGYPWQGERPEPVVYTVTVAVVHTGCRWVMLTPNPDPPAGTILLDGRCIPSSTARVLYRYLWDTGWNERPEGVVYPSLKGYEKDNPYRFLRGTRMWQRSVVYTIRVASVPGVDNSWAMYIGPEDASDREVIGSGFKVLEKEAALLAEQLWGDGTGYAPFERPEFLSREQQVVYRA